MDTISNLIIAIKNAGNANKASIRVPGSALKTAICELLKREGYIKTYHVEGDIKKEIEIVLEYGRQGLPRVSGVKRISKSSKRVYTGVKDITPVKYGHGISVISTPKGLLTDKQARLEQVGGELLFTIW